MAGTNTIVYLAVGDTVTNVGDGTPSSGDYIQLNDNINYVIQEQGFDLSKLTDAMNGTQSAGAAQRTRPLRAMPSRTITLKIICRSTNPVIAPFTYFKQIEYKLKQARDAGGPIGHGTNICLLMKFNPSSIYVAWDVLDGRLFYTDQGYNQGGYFYAELELDILPYARTTAQTWPTLGDGTAQFTNTSNDNGLSSYIFLGNTMSPTFSLASTQIIPYQRIHGILTPPGGQITSIITAWSNTTSTPASTQQFNATTGTTFIVPASVSTFGNFTTSVAGTTQWSVAQWQTAPFTTSVSMSGNVTVGYSIRIPNITLTSWSTQVAIYRVFNNSTGHATLLSPTTIGNAARTTVNQFVSVLGTVAITSSQVFNAGDYIVVEVAVSLVIPASVGSGSILCGLGGNTQPSSDNALLGATPSTQAFVTMPASFTMASSFYPGPLGGTAGALAQIHIQDLSGGGAPTINRIRVGRRSTLLLVGGSLAGQGGTDWNGVINSTTGIGAGNYHTGSLGTGGVVGNDYIESNVLTDASWNDLARFTSGSGSTPLLEQGVYDVWARVAELNTFPITPTGLTVSYTSTGGFSLPAGQYNIRIAGVDGSGNVSQPSPISNVSATYSATPDIFYDGFESADSSQWLEVTNVGSGFNFQDSTVTTSASLAGNYGLHVRFQNDQPTTGTTVPAQIMVLRPFNPPASGNVHATFLCQINQIGGSGFTVLAALGSTDATIAPNGTQNLHSDFVVAFAYTNGSFVMISHAGGGGGGGYVYNTIAGGTVPIGRPFQVQFVVLGHLAASTTYTSSLFIETNLVAVQSTANPGALALTINRFYMGAQSPNLVASTDVYFDEAGLGGPVTAPPQIAVTASWTLVASQITRVYIQRDSGNWQYTDIAAGTVTKQFQALGTFNNGSPPAVATMQPANFRARISVDGSGSVANSILTTPVPALLPTTQWHMVNLGTLTLPPISTFEGLNPLGGSGNGGFSWRLDLQGQNNSGSVGNRLYADALWLFPTDEPQIVAEYPGLQNTVASEWVIDTRRDGRSGTLIRDPSTQNQQGTANTVGNMLLEPGPQYLLFLVEAKNGVHYATSTAYSFQLRWQPLWPYLTENSGF